MRCLLTRDAEEFAARTERLLSSRIECNVLATVLMSVLDGARKDPAPHFAARFAAKEAGLKALGTGLRLGISWLELEVTRERGGPPPAPADIDAHAPEGRARPTRTRMSASSMTIGA